MSVTQSWLGRLRRKTRSTRSSAVPKAGHAAPLAATVAARDPGALHQHRDRIVADPYPAAEHELGVDPVGAVAPVGRGVHLTDQIGQPRVRTARADNGRHFEA